MVKKAQLAGTVWFLLILTFIIMLWVFAIAPIINPIAQQSLQDNNVTGLEAFLWSNLNLVFFVTVILFVLAYAVIMRINAPRRY